MKSWSCYTPDRASLAWLVRDACDLSPPPSVKPAALNPRTLNTPIRVKLSYMGTLNVRG